MKQITIWRREDENTSPRGFGNPPTYSIDKPYTSDADMIWAEPIQCVLPEGYSASKSRAGTMEIYDSNGIWHKIYNYEGHPCINHNGRSIPLDIIDPERGGPEPPKETRKNKYHYER